MKGDKEPERQGEGSVDFRLGPLSQFMIKTVIVLVAVFIVFSYVGSYFDNFAAQLKQNISAATKIGGHDFWARISAELKKQAEPDKDLSAADKQEILADLRIIADRWRPFILEAVAAVTGEATHPAGSNSPPP